MTNGDLTPYLVMRAESGEAEAGRALFEFLAKQLRNGGPISSPLIEYFAPRFEAIASSNAEPDLKKLLNLKYRKGGQHKDGQANFQIWLAVEEALEKTPEDLLAAAVWVEENFDFKKHNRRPVAADRILEIYKEFQRAHEFEIAEFLKDA